MSEWKGTVALVTGAGRGIGQAIALHLAQCGADVAVSDLTLDSLKETVAGLEALGVRAAAFEGNVASADDVQRTVAGTVEKLGRIDVLVNNAGITKDGFLARMSEADWDAVLDVNLKGTFLFTKAAARYMMKQRAGRIVNVASIIGLIGNAGQCNYAASKAGVIALTKSAAKELASRGIRVNAVAPGFIRTRMTDQLTEDIRNRMLDQIPLARFGEAEDVAKVVAFLADEASAYVTGQVLSVCGGMVTA